jgi:hypothetical protein
MSRGGFLVAVLLLLSLALGYLIGDQFHRLFLNTVPPAAVSTFNLGAARFAFVLYGLVAGLAIFVWSLVAALLGRALLGGGRRATPAEPPRPGPATRPTPGATPAGPPPRA